MPHWIEMQLFSVSYRTPAVMNELPLIGSLCYAQRVLGSPWGIQLKLLQRNVWRKVVLASKKTIYKRNQRFFAAVLTGKDESNVNTWEVQVFVEIIMRYVIKSTDKVLSLRKVYCAIDIS